MARHLAQSLRKKALEINTVDLNKQALKASDRLDCYRFCQAILARSSNALVIFDEVEEILSDGSFSGFGFREGLHEGPDQPVLETNATPAIWITNTVRGVDPAYLRRFDMVVQLNTPVERFKKKIAWRVFKDLPINESVVDRMVRHKKVTPAHFEKVNRICQRIGVSTPEEAGLVASKILNGDLKAVHAGPLETARPEKKKRRIELPYRPDLINCDADIQALTQNLDVDASVRICSFGPPGTGKTAWARHLAESLDKPLLVKHAADILDKYLGETEKNTAEVFREAGEDRQRADARRGRQLPAGSRQCEPSLGDHTGQPVPDGNGVVRGHPDLCHEPEGQPGPCDDAALRLQDQFRLPEAGAGGADRDRFARGP